MNNFWNIGTILIFGVVICLIIFAAANYIFSLEIDNILTLIAIFVTVLSTLYSNYKSDERVNKQIKSSEEQFKKQLEQNEKNLKVQLLFNKKQESYIRLYGILNKYGELFDDEKVEHYIINYRDYEPYNYIDYEIFSEIHQEIFVFSSSPDFLYMPYQIQKTIDNFLKFVNNNLEGYDYFKYEFDKNYYNAIEILSEIYPILKQEIGFKK